MESLFNLKGKVNTYKKILGNTKSYRQAWLDHLKKFIIERLEFIVSETGLSANIEVTDHIENLETITLSLGTLQSGLREKISDDAVRPMIKHNGVLIYQQLFNGKIQVMIMYPFIEGYGKPQPPKMISIYRPEEIKEPFIVRHMEEFIKEIINWEDFDDEQPVQPIGFSLPLKLEENEPKITT
jgi:hypothetical protein